MIRWLASRSAMVSNSGTMRSALTGSGPGTSRPTSLSSTATSSMSDTLVVLEIT